MGLIHSPAKKNYFRRLFRDLFEPPPADLPLRTSYRLQPPSSDSDAGRTGTSLGALTFLLEVLHAKPSSGEHGAVVSGVADNAALYDISTGLSLKIVQFSLAGSVHAPLERHGDI